VAGGRAHLFCHYCNFLRIPVAFSMCADSSLVLRVRSRDGLERVRVQSLDCSVSELKQSIRQQLFAPGDGQEILALSTNKDLLTKDDIGASLRRVDSLSPPRTPLADHQCRPVFDHEPQVSVPKVSRTCRTA
jgi:hypothetical protein